MFLVHVKTSLICTFNYLKHIQTQQPIFIFMSRPFVDRSFILLFFTIVLLVSCKTKEEKPAIDYNALPTQEKRLPENAMASMEVAEGLKMNLFASEPMIANPTNMAIDAKGRIWI